MEVSQSQNFLIQWHITESCNLRCRHCYQDSTSSYNPSLSEVKYILNEIMDMLEAWSEVSETKFRASFNITGGEPLMYPQLYYIIAAIAAHGADVTLLTNGTLIDKQAARQLKLAGTSEVQISIEGTKPVHNRIRGRHTYEAALRGASCLISEDIPVTFNTTLSLLNSWCFPELIKIAKEESIQKLGFSRLVPSGNGKNLLAHALNKDQVMDLYQWAWTIPQNGVRLVCGDPLYTQVLTGNVENNGDVPIGGCAAGLSALTLMPDGTVLPCRRLNIPIGNLNRDSLREIWTTSELLESLRNKAGYGEKCSSCDRWAMCRGCRAIAYAYTGDVLADDPHCFIGNRARPERKN